MKRSAGLLTISERGGTAGQSEGIATAPDALELTSDGRPRILDGDCTDKTAIRSATVVDGEARTRHIRGPRGENDGGLIIQHRDETSASRDECDADQLGEWQNGVPAAQTRRTPAARIFWNPPCGTSAGP